MKCHFNEPSDVIILAASFSGVLFGVTFFGSLGTIMGPGEWVAAGRPFVGSG